MNSTDLRAAFAARLSALYGQEVPLYTTLVEVAQEVNARVMARAGAAAERLGSIERVTAERHGAIRVGTPRELAQVAKVFAALGMHPVGFYDLRDAHPAPIPVVSTAFRPVDPDELAANPFRVFTSMLVPADRRFFDADVQARLEAFLDARELFPPELLEIAAATEAAGGLTGPDAERFLDLATAAFALSPDPVDAAWYAELEAVSAVAADIGGVRSTHVNHLTPRVLDIDDLYRSMTARGVEMIDAIQGPPAWDGPDVLLRQTSFRALAESRLFADVDGTVRPGSLRVRFGEVEARGIALTPAGRECYDDLTARGGTADDWNAALPPTEAGLEAAGLAFFTYHVVSDGPAASLADLIDAGHVQARPIVYEDFLPRSAAGIFASNLDGTTAAENAAETQGGAPIDLDSLAAAIGRPVHVPEDLYAAQSRASLDAVEARLGVVPAVHRVRRH